MNTFSDDYGQSIDKYIAYTNAEKGMEVVDSIDLGRGGVGPGEPERGESRLHRGQNEARFLAQAVRGDITAANDEVAVVRLAFRRFAAARDDEASIFSAVNVRVAKSVERRLWRREHMGPGLEWYSIRHCPTL